MTQTMPRTKGKLRVHVNVLSVPSVHDARWTRDGQPPLPSWLSEIREDQWRVTERAVERYALGDRVVMLNAPVGSGKSLIGELVRRELNVQQGLYVCTTKSLQNQYVTDFGYARVLKGRTNYQPNGDGARQQSRHARLLDERAGGGRGGIVQRITCGDCDRGPMEEERAEQSCTWCEYVETCPYLVARDRAQSAPVGVLNSAYALASWNHNPMFRDRDLVVVDESDLMEQQLMGFVEVRVPRKVVSELGLTVPKKGSHMPTIRAWLVEEVAVKVAEMVRDIKRTGIKTVEARREIEKLEGLVEDCARVGDREDGWVRDGGEEDGDGGRRGSVDGLVLKPVHVGDVGEQYLWRHARRWLLMTGTLVSGQMEAESLGLEQSGNGVVSIPWDVVEAPMTFPVENRPVIYVPAGKMTRKEEEQGIKGVLRALEVILEKHPGVNVLVHTHTYKLAKQVTEHIKRHTTARGNRPVITYESGWKRDEALGLFKEHAWKGGAVLVAASMDRGVDLPGDLCRVQVICKVPYASLGDKQVSARLKSPGGDLWYKVQTIRSVQQMTGRAVRGVDDWATTYILDESFGKLYGEGRRMGLWNQWWMDGLETARLREYL